MDREGQVIKRLRPWMTLAVIVVGALAWASIPAKHIGGGVITPSIGTTSSTQHAFPTGTSDLCSVDESQTLTNKTLTTPTLSGAVSGTYTLGGTPTLGAVLTTNAFVGPNYGGTSTNVPTVTWTNVTFQNSWTDYSVATYGNTHYFKDALGIVHLSGIVKSGTTATAVMFTLPAGYRPAHDLAMLVAGQATGSAAVLSITATGDVSTTTGGSISLNSIGPVSFMAEQ